MTCTQRVPSRPCRNYSVNSAMPHPNTGLAPNYCQARWQLDEYCRKKAGKIIAGTDKTLQSNVSVRRQVPRSILSCGVSARQRHRRRRRACRGHSSLSDCKPACFPQQAKACYRVTLAKSENSRTEFVQLFNTLPLVTFRYNSSDKKTAMINCHSFLWDKRVAGASYRG